MKFLENINKLIHKLYKNKSDKKMNNVLVVSNSGLGDTLLATPAIKTLKKSFPNLNITFMIQKFLYPLFTDFEYVDDFIFYKKGFFNQIKIIKEIKKRNIDTIFLFHSNGPEDMFFSMMSGAKNILKFSDKDRHEFQDIFLNTLSSEKKHVIEKKIDLVRIFEPKVIDTKLEVGKNFYISKEKHNNLKIGIQLGAQDIYKMWPLENFILLAKKLKDYFKCEFILFGSGVYENKLANRFEKEIECKNLCSKTSIKELAYKIRDLDLLITNDTGTMHLAIALQTPTVELFSPTDSKLYGRYQDENIHKVIQKDGTFVNIKPKKERTNEAMKLISVDEAFEVTKDLIKELYEDTFDKK